MNASIFTKRCDDVVNASYRTSRSWFFATFSESDFCSSYLTLREIFFFKTLTKIFYIPTVFLYQKFIFRTQHIPVFNSNK